MGPRKQFCFVRLLIHHGESTGKVKKTTFCTSVTKLRSCSALVEKERCLIHGIGDEGVDGVDNDGADAQHVRNLVEAILMFLLFCKEVRTCPRAVLAHVYKYNVVEAHLHSWRGDLEFLLRK